MNERKQLYIAILAVVAIVGYLLSAHVFHISLRISNIWLMAALFLGGVPLIVELIVKISKGQFGSDLLAGISIVVSVLLHQYLAGVLVVLMLSGGEALEGFALRRASSVLDALAKRMPSRAHRKNETEWNDVPVSEIVPGDVCVVLPHEICPVDGVVVEGRGSMDESYLTGEPFLMAKTVGSNVIAGSVNGNASLTVKAIHKAEDSRYTKIMAVMHTSQQQRPQLRRLADSLGAWYTPVALLIATVAGLISHDPLRFLSVLVIATPCPLLIAIPVAIIGAISLNAKRGIIIKDPAILEHIDQCRVVILDKTGTLTYGTPQLSAQHYLNGFDKEDVLTWAASLERYSKHPLAQAVVEAAKEAHLPVVDAVDLTEKPGQGLQAMIKGRQILITGRARWLSAHPTDSANLNTPSKSLECLVVVDDKIAAVYQFQDKPRAEGKSFIGHLSPRHGVKRVMIISGDGPEHVEQLAQLMGITETYAQQSPEQKLAIVKRISAQYKTMYLGDGINDGPALLSATVGIAFGANDVTSAAAGAVIMESSLIKVDELIHISKRMRIIALQSALGGMILSIVGMFLAAAGHLTPVAGALAQEFIDIFAVLNALRASLYFKKMSDM